MAYSRRVLRSQTSRLLVAAVLFVVSMVAIPSSALAAYRDVIAATPDLVSYWRFGESSGVIAADSTGLQDGTYAASPGLGAGGALVADPSTAMNVDSAGDRFSSPHRIEYANASTVQFWVRLNSYGDTTKYRAMASKGYVSSERNWLIALGNNATGQLTYGFGSGGQSIGRRSAATLALNRWYLVTYVRTAAKVQLYLDGVLDSELVTTVVPAASTAPVVVGDDGQTAAFANALYDEFALYSRALSAAEVAAHYRAGTNPANVCAKVASPAGADTNVGSVAQPYRTSQKLADSLAADQTGCLRAGTYTNNKLTLSTAGTTLQTYPGDARAKISGAVWLRGDRITVQALALDGTVTQETTSVTINGVGDVVRNNDITNGHTRICIVASEYQGLRARNFLIERNRIHNCGRINPTTNHDHGVYLDGDDGVVRDNAMYDNAARGVQIYPGGDRNRIENNTIDGNGEGVLFGGGSTSASDNNIVKGNVISNSTIRWLVEANYPGVLPVGNLVQDNCLYASIGGYYGSNGGIDPNSGYAFTVSGSIFGDPLFVNRAAKDFRLAANSGCAGKGAPRDV